MKHLMTLHNIGSNSEGSDSEDMATEITKNRQFWPLYIRLRLHATQLQEYPHEPYTAWK